MKSIRIVTLILAMVLALAGCGGGASVDGEESVLVIGIQDEIEGTDIQQIGWENVVQALIYEPLVVFSEDLSVMHPALAESYEIAADGLSIKFTLQEGLQFSNGNVCDAQAVKASVERYLSISEYAGDLEAVTSVEVLDPLTVQCNLSSPAPYMWASIASTYGGIVDAAAAAEVSDDEFNRAAVTIGPYAVESWAQGSEIVLVRNEYYKTVSPLVSGKTAPAFDKIVVRFIPDEFTRVSELESGNVDIIFDVPSSSIQDLQSNKDINTYLYKQAGATYINLQTGYGPTESIKVREAIAYALDKEEIATALDGVVTPLYGFISEAQAGYSPDKEADYASTYAFDAEKAKALLAEDGWTDSDGDGIVDKNGEKLTIELLTSSDRATIKAAAPVIQTQLQAVGIDLQLREYESSYIKQMMKDDDYIAGTRNFVWNDADILYYVFTENSGYPWSDPSVTAALEAARYVVDPAERVQAYEDAQDQLIPLMKAVSLFADNYCIATKKSVSGLVVTNDGRTYFNDVTKE